MIFNIQRYSTHDGPGIRTVIFLKGCSLSCFWCQNPESQSTKPELMLDQRLCIKNCQLCCKQHPNLFQKKDEMICINRQPLSAKEVNDITPLCPSLAITVCGEEQSVDEIMHVINKDAHFYQRTDGGVTLSGGEPFMQPTLCENLLQQCKQHHYHTAVETCLHTPWKNIEPSLAHLDLLLTDLKHTDEKKVNAWTRGSAKRILDNFRRLAQFDKQIIIRVPLIQGFNADQKSVKDIIDFAANETATNEIHFLPYHTLGINKYAMLDRPYHAPPTPFDDEDIIDYAMQYARQNNLTAILRG